MSSILTPFFMKRYKPFEELEYTINVDSNEDIVVCNYEGSIHSIYIKLDQFEYDKIFSSYNTFNILNNQEFNFYTNNKIGCICYIDKQNYNKQCEKFSICQSDIYNFKNSDVCYAIDRYEDRVTLPMNSINDVSLRLNAYGNWITLDHKHTVLLGCRLIYKNHPDDLEFISQSSRSRRELVNLNQQSATINNHEVKLNVFADKFIIFRTVNYKNFCFNKKDVMKYICQQKLYHLIEKKTNLLINDHENSSC
ncbi:KM727_gp86-like protein [Aratus pisonii nudivirus]|nr:KM727_gp86-like protein [Aratus pisonii nudivirus]